MQLNILIHWNKHVLKTNLSQEALKSESKDTKVAMETSQQKASHIIKADDSCLMI